MRADTINYPYLIDQAMRGVVRDVLKKVQISGLPANHHFYISFSTTHPDVKISEQLREKYPKEITIVIQHQYWDLQVDEEKFTVSMSFAGIPEKLIVPFAALLGFADPSIKFGLQFQTLEDSSDFVPPPVDFVATKSEEEHHDSGEKIISLDSFRKK